MSSVIPSGNTSKTGVLNANRILPLIPQNKQFSVDIHRTRNNYSQIDRKTNSKRIRFL